MRELSRKEKGRTPRVSGMTEPRSPERRDWFERRAVELLPELHGAALRLAGNEPDAEDLVAEAIARAWEKLETLEDDDSFRGWVFRILTNAFLAKRRSRASRGVHESYEEASDGESFSLFEKLHQPFLLWWGSPEREFLSRLLREDLERAIDSLPDAYRVVVVLADVQGFSYREIADALDVPIGTVRSRLARGRAKLQEALWTHAVDAGLREPRDEHDNSAAG